MGAGGGVGRGLELPLPVRQWERQHQLRDGQAILSRKLAAMNAQEQREYWRKRTEELRDLQRKVRRQQRLSQG